METSVGGMLVMGVLVAMVILLSRAFVVSNSVMGAAIKEAAEFSGERARTMLSFETSTSNGTDITVDVKNTGNTSVSDYEDMDFIVVYEDCEGRRDNVPPGRSSAEVWRLKTVPPVAIRNDRT